MPSVRRSRRFCDNTAVLIPADAPRRGAADRGEYREAAKAATFKPSRQGDVHSEKKTGAFKVEHAHTVGALVVILSNASAQVPEPNVSPWQKKALTPSEQKERQKKLDDAYKAATKNIPDQKSNDPWATVRPTTPTTAPNQR